MAKFYSDPNPYGEVVEFTTGDAINILRGQSSSVDEETRQLQQEEYRLKQSLALQEEYDQASEELSRAFPDGRGYAEAANKYLANRVKQIIENSPDQSVKAKAQLLSVLGSFQERAANHAREYEKEVARVSTTRTYMEAKENLMGDIYRQPGLAEPAIPELVDKIKTIGPALKWTPEEIDREIEQSVKQVYHTSIMGLVNSDPMTAQSLLKTGYYDNVLSEPQKEVFRKRIKDSEKFSEQMLTSMKNPDEVIQRAKLLSDSDSKTEDILSNPNINPIDLAVTAKLREKERQRMSNPNYNLAKKRLEESTKTVLGLTDEDRSYRLERLRTMHDDNSMTSVNVEQVIREINLDTQNRITQRVTIEMQKSNYIQGDLNKMTSETVNESKRRIAQDKQAGRISHEKALIQLKILNKIGAHINGR